jgi:AcrR family transcriptional regulator
MNKTERIIEAARRRFFYYGINKTTMQEIAAEAGVAVGTLYLYFSNKDALMVACAENFVERHRRLADEIMAADTPVEQKLRDYVLARFRESQDLRTGTRHAIELARAVMRLKPDRVQEEGMIMHEVITTILKRGVRDRVFRIAQVEDDAMVFLFSIAWFFPSALAPPPMEPEETDLLRVIDWFLRAWKSRPAAARAAARKRRRSARS